MTKHKIITWIPVSLFEYQKNSSNSFSEYNLSINKKVQTSVTFLVSPSGHTVRSQLADWAKLVKEARKWESFDGPWPLYTDRLEKLQNWLLADWPVLASKGYCLAVLLVFLSVKPNDCCLCCVLCSKHWFRLLADNLFFIVLTRGLFLLSSVQECTE